MSDAEEVKLTELAPIILTGPDTLGLPLDELSPAAEAALRSSDLVMGKGQANYYALSEIVNSTGAWEGPLGHVYSLLCTKCRPVAASLGCPDRSRINVAVRLGEGE
jgi:uncharacterized protein with ATP-grasp and redox domains